MTDQTNDGNDDYLELRKEFLAGRQFSLAEVIGREGGSFLKGESPVPKLLQAKAEINLFIDRNLVDSSGALKAVLQILVATDDVDISRQLNSPLNALREFLETLIHNPQLLYEFVKQVDIKWGQFYGERPYFQQPGQLPHPDDEYTHESVHQQLVELLHRLNSYLSAYRLPTSSF
ncbi:hypothetical protein [Egbenema bharatensis]|uniref:hypothetical protein n=1 Tax=Egbenema bharatensis TaxID=3463334 RepID=UPI003A84F7AA